MIEQYRANMTKKTEVGSFKNRKTKKEKPSEIRILKLKTLMYTNDFKIVLKYIYWGPTW